MYCRLCANLLGRKGRHVLSVRVNGLGVRRRPGVATVGKSVASQPILSDVRLLSSFSSLSSSSSSSRTDTPGEDSRGTGRRGIDEEGERVTWRDVVEYGLKGLAVILLSYAVYDEIIMPWYRAYQRKKQFELTLKEAHLERRESSAIDIVPYGSGEESSVGQKSSFPSAKCSTSGSNGHSSPSRQFNFLAEAVEKAAPSVVFIEKSQSVSTIFGPQMAVSSGSGFIVSEDGFVLTNAHVVGGARSVKVKLASGEIVKGEVTEIDQISDLALLKLRVNKPLPAIKFGNSSSLRPGEWVVAMGSPLSLSNTITAGIVSSAQRPSSELGLQRRAPDMQYVQTDAPITVGNSGGPLVNLDGEVIGVNTLTAGPGISFAIPSDFAKSFVASANKTAHKSGNYAIGISMLTITPDISQALQQRGIVPAGVDQGVFVAQVWSSSVAAQAGLKKGDIIVQINGTRVTSSNHVFNVVQTGQRLSMEVIRNSERKTVHLVPEKL